MDELLGIAGVGKHTAETLINLAHEYKVAEITIGRRGQSGIKSLLFGSVAGSLMQTSDIPVTVADAADLPEELEGEFDAVTGFFFLPTFFVGPLGGVLADRVERRNVLVAAQVCASLKARKFKRGTLL